MPAEPGSDTPRYLGGAQAHLAAAREPRAAGPGPEAEALRSAYLDLLKLASATWRAPSTILGGRAGRTAA